MRLLLFLLVFMTGVVCLADNLPVNLLRAPTGFHIEVYAYPVPGARSLALGDNGTVFVGTRENGKVYAIIPDKKAPHHTRIITIAEGLNSPNGVAFHNGSLYVAEISRILRYINIEKELSNPAPPIVITRDLPNEMMHGWRYIGFNPRGKLFVSIGMPCNVCLQADPRFGTIISMNPDGSHAKIYVTGLRKSDGMDWDPIDNRLWLTDSGRDWMGDDMPPDKLNAASQGMNFGFPYFDGKHLPDPQFGSMAPFENYDLPTLELPAHVAPFGIRFYTGTMFPLSYRNQIFVAEHGSTNRATPVGYQIVVVNRIGTQVKNVRPFITGWLQNQQAWGRPVDVLVMPDGALLISDDLAGAIYRVTYH
jgi:glucose/arabinose dehydrogenase